MNPSNTIGIEIARDLTCENSRFLDSKNQIGFGLLSNSRSSQKILINL